ncbi:uncharacterized protein HMPREF1541_04243 [Cyphellophora europaea CBS 101466]|uniref:DUF7924 domain-containing protein n=1 Tax=Cyphellophora europaea (strain CBS 101466) TaxID=1220924 RepID=W2S0V1_CYPE1|nr:uncharacterized protein HMPREF1541_04243 [Cyphellophora europaea CBS 101466]ETN42302.1 hypothetical protein HMPREF1541_04243 [Cyphellophora europaea CBS 101466]
MFDLRETLLSRKRRRDSSASLLEEPSEGSFSVKRQKRTQEAGSRRRHRSPGFWDRLSKVPLCRGSLREFDRRISASGQQPLTSTALVPSARGPRSQHLKRFARHGGPDLTYLRGFASSTEQDGIMSQSSSSRKRSSASSRSATSSLGRSSHDPAFEQNMIDRGIYPHNRGSKPENLESTRDYLARSRASLSPSKFRDEDFEEFTELCERASGETSARADVIAIIEGNGRKKYRHGADHVFNNLDPLDDPLDSKLPKPKPDHYDGALPQDIDHRVRRDLTKHIVPCNNTAWPAAPNFFLEAKGDSGRADVLKRQACHDGAVGARAIHSLENYRAPEPQYDGHAKSFSSTYHHGTSTLTLYGHHTTQPKVPGGRPEYHMTQVGGYFMTHDREAFQKAAGAFRNLRDLSRTHRDSAIEHANQVARHAPADSPSTVLTDSRTSLSALQEDPSDTSTDELTAEHTSAKRSRHDPQALPKPPRVATTPTPLTSSRSRHDANVSVPSQQVGTRRHQVPSNSGSRRSLDDSTSEWRSKPAEGWGKRHAESHRHAKPG